MFQHINSSSICLLLVSLLSTHCGKTKFAVDTNKQNRSEQQREGSDANPPNDADATGRPMVGDGQGEAGAGIPGSNLETQTGNPNSNTGSNPNANPGTNPNPNSITNPNSGNKIGENGLVYTKPRCSLTPSRLEITKGESVDIVFTTGGDVASATVNGETVSTKGEKFSVTPPKGDLIYTGVVVSPSGQREICGTRVTVYDACPVPEKIFEEVSFTPINSAFKATEGTKFASYPVGTKTTIKMVMKCEVYDLLNKEGTFDFVGANRGEFNSNKAEDYAVDSYWVMQKQGENCTRTFLQTFDPTAERGFLINLSYYSTLPEYKSCDRSRCFGVEFLLPGSQFLLPIVSCEGRDNNN